MNDIIERVLQRSGRDVGLETREKVSNYINLLASTGKSNRQLMRFGTAYLRELFEPDSRYSGW